MKCKDQRNHCFNLKGDFLKMEQIILLDLKVKLIAISFSDTLQFYFKLFFVNVYLVLKRKTSLHYFFKWWFLFAGSQEATWSSMITPWLCLNILLTLSQDMTYKIKICIHIVWKSKTIAGQNTSLIMLLNSGNMIFSKGRTYINYFYSSSFCFLE